LLDEVFTHADFFPAARRRCENVEGGIAVLGAFDYVLTMVVCLNDEPDFGTSPGQIGAS